jgi:putative membrane protein
MLHARACYELLVGAVATIVSPELGAAYLGSQGDSWDAQKDAFLALSGALLAMTLSWLWARSREHG